MRSLPLRLAAAVLGLGLLSLAPTACVHHHHGHGHGHTKARGGGPPPWAPAHGYRHKHASGVELSFDAGIGVYVVVGHAGHYFHGDRFYRKSGGSWSASVAIGGPWLAVSVGDLPPGLRGSGKKAKPGRGHGPPAKHKHK